MGKRRQWVWEPLEKTCMFFLFQWRTLQRAWRTISLVAVLLQCSKTRVMKPWTSSLWSCLLSTRFPRSSTFLGAQPLLPWELRHGWPPPGASYTGTPVWKEWKHEGVSRGENNKPGALGLGDFPRPKYGGGGIETKHYFDGWCLCLSLWSYVSFVLLTVHFAV